MTLSSIEYLDLFENTSFIFHTISITKLIIYFKLNQIMIKKYYIIILKQTKQIFIWLLTQFSDLNKKCIFISN